MLVTDALRVAYFCAVLFAIFGLGNWAVDRGPFSSVLNWREAIAIRRQVQASGGNGSEELKLVLCRVTALLSMLGAVASLSVALFAYLAQQLF